MNENIIKMCKLHTKKYKKKMFDLKKNKINIFREKKIQTTNKHDIVNNKNDKL